MTQRGAMGGPPAPEAHDHHWEPVGIYDFQVGSDAALGMVRKGVALSCACGVVQGHELPTLLRSTPPSEKVTG